MLPLLPASEPTCSQCSEGGLGRQRDGVEGLWEQEGWEGGGEWEERGREGGRALMRGELWKEGERAVALKQVASKQGALEVPIWSWIEPLWFSRPHGKLDSRGRKKQ